MSATASGFILPQHRLPEARTVIDLYVPSARRSLQRSINLCEKGIFRLARRDSMLMSIMIASSGAWGRLRIMNGEGRKLWEMPSSFTGSFYLGAGSDGGLIVELASRDRAPEVTVSWREPDQQMV